MDFYSINITKIFYKYFIVYKKISKLYNLNNNLKYVLYL